MKFTMKRIDKVSKCAIFNLIPGNRTTFIKNDKKNIIFPI